MCCAADNHNYILSHMCKRIFWFELQCKKLLTKYQIFTKLLQIPHIHMNRNFLKYICNFLDQLLLPYTFHDRDMSGILFFIFASCEPLKHFFRKYSFLWVGLTLGDFTVKKRQILKGNLYNWKSIKHKRNVLCGSYNHIFHEIAPNWTFVCLFVCLFVFYNIWKEIDQPLLPYRFCGMNLFQK